MDSVVDISSQVFKDCLGVLKQICEGGREMKEIIYDIKPLKSSVVLIQDIAEGEGLTLEQVQSIVAEKSVQ